MHPRLITGFLAGTAVLAASLAAARPRPMRPPPGRSPRAGRPPRRPRPSCAATAVSFGQQPVHRRVPLPGSLGHLSGARRGGRRRARCPGRTGAVLFAGRGRGEAAAVPGDRSLGSPAEVVP